MGIIKKSILGIVWENTVSGTELPRIFCAGMSISSYAVRVDLFTRMSISAQLFKRSNESVQFTQNYSVTQKYSLPQKYSATRSPSSFQLLNTRVHRFHRVASQASGWIPYPCLSPLTSPDSPDSQPSRVMSPHACLSPLKRPGVCLCMTDHVRHARMRCMESQSADLEAE